MGEPFSGDEAPLDIVSDCLNVDNIQVVERGSDSCSPLKAVQVHMGVD
jgi:hypothetical protein